MHNAGTNTILLYTFNNRSTLSQLHVHCTCYLFNVDPIILTSLTNWNLRYSGLSTLGCQLDGGIIGWQWDFRENPPKKHKKG